MKVKSTTTPNILLELRNVSKVYHMGADKLYAIDHVNLKIAAGEFISIVGPSGSGKSTLMHLVGILDNPTSGEILLEGKNVARLKEKELAKIRNKKIGFIFQAFNLLQRTTALSNVELPMIYAGIKSTLRHQIAHQKLDDVGLSDKMSNWPSQLSGGQQQRVAIARALVNNPAIILADEPTGNLDSKSGAEVMRVLEGLHEKGHTVIIVTHDETLAQEADRIIQIKDGRIVNDFINTTEKRR
jgi:putative ABC transport system ATP-binding protein